MPFRHSEGRQNAVLVCLVTLWLLFIANGVDAQGWRDHRVVGPFVCQADFPLVEYDHVFSELGQIQQELTARLGLPPAQEPIAIYLFETERRYRDYLRQQFPDVPYRRALFYKDQGPGVVLAYRSSQLEVDLRHECTHALLHASLPMVPLWLDEGLAEYFEVPAAERASENPHHSAIKWNMRFGMVPELKRLESWQRLDEMGRSEYRYAWAWAHFLLHGPPQARQTLQAYFADVAAHAPPGQVSDRLARVYADPEGALVEHFKRFR
ncbi:MAG: hypothetical protein DWQ35_09920 [Planctomycetota bacterium]|nr:MAG: hypothetical protein DWQ35_09920 [Planctomycetota bacterium]REK25708.1 MAG: hypothetical protein DWQ42_10660 [Planctomycetota bacterium]REK46546.1 MAG: hypothetical protein DWQ46_06645 [Planctomycetota bacterium]